MFLSTILKFIDMDANHTIFLKMTRRARGTVSDSPLRIRQHTESSTLARIAVLQVKARQLSRAVRSGDSAAERELAGIQSQMRRLQSATSTSAGRSLSAVIRHDVGQRAGRSSRSLVQSSAHNVSKHGVYAGAFRLGQHTLILLGASSSSFVGSESIVYNAICSSPHQGLCHRYAVLLTSNIIGPQLQCKSRRQPTLEEAYASVFGRAAAPSPLLFRPRSLRSARYSDF